VVASIVVSKYANNASDAIPGISTTLRRTPQRLTTRRRWI
jgi:hypothetical protein